MRRMILCVLIAACGGDDGETIYDDGGFDDGGGDAPDAAPPIALGCDPLPITGSPVINVSPGDAAQLGQIIADAPAGAAIVFADGTYDVAGDVVMNVSKPMTLISAAGRSSAVTISGGPSYSAREILQITSSDVTVAHLTFTNAQDHLIHLYPGGQQDLADITLYELGLYDAGQQFIKSNANEGNAQFAQAEFVDEVTVACSDFGFSEAGRDYVPTNPHNDGYPCYTGGIDAHAARSWHVVRNRFVGIYCNVDSLAEHAIHFWQSGRDQVVEQNLVIDCARGIGLGLTDGGSLVERPYADDPHAGERVDPYVGNVDGIIRNNVVFAEIDGFDSGISLEQAIGARVYHNTVVVAGAASGNAIEYRFGNSIVDIRNNLATSVVMRDGGSGQVTSNLAAGADAFVSVLGEDFHLVSGAPGIDSGEVLTEAGLDLDDEPHTRGPPDLGADER